MQKRVKMLIIFLVIGIGFFSGCSTTSNIENKLQITSFQIDQGGSTGSGGNIYMSYIATVKVANYGSNIVSNSELTITLYKNNNIADSQMKQLENIGKNSEVTQKVTISDSHYSYEAQYKVVVTIKVGSKILDIKSMNL
jgi:outer membrane protein assembly factor BamE (lipoprotein component of BamABCDE complex)